MFFNNKKNLKLEIPDNANLYYLTNEGYLEKEKGDNYLIIIQIGEKWYSLIGFENYISYSNFKIILMTKTNNLFEELIKYFPKDCQYINTNLFETLLKLFNDKTIEIINDRNNVLNLINNNENVHIFSNKGSYYNFNKDNYIFTPSKLIQYLIDKINYIIENDDEFNNIKEYEKKHLNDIEFINNYNSSSEDNIEKISNNEEKENDENNEKNNEISTNIHKVNINRFLIQKPTNKKIKKIKKMNKYDFGENEINNIEISEIISIEVPKILTINSLIKYYNDCELGTLVLPLYIYKTKKSKNSEDIKLDNNYDLLKNDYMKLLNQLNEKDIEFERNKYIEEYVEKYKKKVMNYVK